MPRGQRGSATARNSTWTRRAKAFAGVVEWLYTTTRICVLNEDPRSSGLDAPIRANSASHLSPSGRSCHAALPSVAEKRPNRGCARVGSGWLPITTITPARRLPVVPSCWPADRCPTAVRGRETQEWRRGSERGLGNRPSSFSRIAVSPPLTFRRAGLRTSPRVPTQLFCRRHPTKVLNRRSRSLVPVPPVIAGESHRQGAPKRDPPLSCTTAGRGSTDMRAVLRPPIRRRLRGRPWSDRAAPARRSR
jgi:hypothetical protein